MSRGKRGKGAGLVVHIPVGGLSKDSDGPGRAIAEGGSLIVPMGGQRDLSNVKKKGKSPRQVQAKENKVWGGRHADVF